MRDLWAQCRALDIPLPKPEPVSQASMHAARRKVHDEVFFRIHREILRRAPPDEPRTLWYGHRTFAVDGSKLNLPQPLLENGYRRPSDGSHYPQGLLSCLFRLRSRLPVDFELAPHGDERRLALAHLPALAPSAVVVYDRGYFCFRLLHTHLDRGLHAVFRLKSNANSVCEQFRRSGRRDGIVTIAPSDTAREQQPEAGWRPAASACSATPPATPTTCSPPPCSTAAATPSGPSRTSTMRAGAWKNCTRAANNTCKSSASTARASAWSARSSAPISACSR